VTLAELTTRSERMRTRIATTRAEIEQLDAHIASATELRSVVARLDAFGDRVRDGLSALNWIDKRQLIRTLIARVEIQPDGATIVYRVPQAVVAERPAPSPQDASTESPPPKMQQMQPEGAGPENPQSCQLRGRRNIAAPCEYLLALRA